MSKFNPSKARQDWQHFKERHPAVEKLPNYPKGIGALLDGNVKLMQLAVAAYNEYNRMMQEFARGGRRIDLKQKEAAYQKYDKALERVQHQIQEIGQKLRQLDSLIKAHEAKDHPR